MTAAVVTKNQALLAQMKEVLGDCEVFEPDFVYAADPEMVEAIGDDLLVLPPQQEWPFLCGSNLDDATIWRRAVTLRVTHVVWLPDASDWIVDHCAVKP